MPLGDNQRFWLPSDPLGGRREETLLCKIPAPLASAAWCPLHRASRQTSTTLSPTRVDPEFRVSSHVSTWATADPERAFPSPLLASNSRLAPVTPRPAGSRSLRNPGKGHSLGVATRGLPDRRQPIVVRHTRAPANQRPYCSCVPPAPALFFPASPALCLESRLLLLPRPELTAAWGSARPWRCPLPPVAFTEDESLRSCVPTPSRPRAHFHLATGEGGEGSTWPGRAERGATEASLRPGAMGPRSLYSRCG